MFSYELRQLVVVFLPLLHLMFPIADNLLKTFFIKGSEVTCILHRLLHLVLAYHKVLGRTSKVFEEASNLFTLLVPIGGLETISSKSK
jgi:hypothetical protein